MIASGNSVITEQQFGEVVEDTTTREKGLYALSNWLPGQLITSFGARAVLDSPNYLSVQTGEHEHILLAPELLQYINHSCDPNVFFDTTAGQLICLKPVNAGDEFTFFYPSAEWHMQQPFVCNCKHEHCLRLIEGAYALTSEIKSRYRFTDFILMKFEQPAF